MSVKVWTPVGVPRSSMLPTSTWKFIEVMPVPGVSVTVTSFNL